jgi:hypothetical protein
MTPPVIKVMPVKDYELDLTFGNGEVKRFDMKPYLDMGLFTNLKDEKEFNKVKVVFDTIEWENKLDIDPEILYQQGVTI